MKKIGIGKIQRIQFDKLQKDFSFIVNGKIYKTNSFVANILSPNISNKFSDDISYYEIKTKYEGDFNRVIEYGEMKEIDIKPDENLYFLSIMKLLGNNSEAIRFFKEEHKNITYENVIQRIKTKKEFDINFDEEITFISRNFHDFNAKYPEAIFTLNFDIIEQIISNDNLKLLDEEELFDIVLKLYSKSKENSELFSYVNFIILSNKSIKRFIENFDINDINASIWKKICCRLDQDISNESKKSYGMNLKHHEFLNNRYSARKYERIIQHLSEQYHGNPHTHNVVQITSSSIRIGSPEYTIVQDDDKTFGTESRDDSWVQFDFKERRVLLDGYTLKTVNWDRNDGHLKNWILEVSNDGKDYKEIDRHEKCDLLNGNLRTATFKVSCSTPQRFVRLKQIGPSWSGCNYLNINQVEFSGFLYE